jgi:hypothetical protein
MLPQWVFEHRSMGRWAAPDIDTDHDPETRDQNTATRSLDPETTSPKAGTQDPEPGAESPKPEPDTRGPESPASSPTALKAKEGAGRRMSVRKRSSGMQDGGLLDEGCGFLQVAPRSGVVYFIQMPETLDKGLEVSGFGFRV